MSRQTCQTRAHAGCAVTLKSSSGLRHAFDPISKPLFDKTESPSGICLLGGRTNGNVRRCYCKVVAPMGNAVRELGLMSAREVKSGTRSNVAWLQQPVSLGMRLRLVNFSEECLTGSAEQACPGVGKDSMPGRPAARQRSCLHWTTGGLTMHQGGSKRLHGAAASRKAAREGLAPKPIRDQC